MAQWHLPNAKAFTASLRPPGAGVVATTTLVAQEDLVTLSVPWNFRESFRVIVFLVFSHVHTAVSLMVGFKGGPITLGVIGDVSG